MTRLPHGLLQTGDGTQIGTCVSTSTRRRFLTALSTATATTALAGCLDGDDEVDGNDDRDRDDESTDDGSQTDDGRSDDENGNDENDDPSSTVPDSFADPDELRQYSREFIELLATGETDVAEAWADPEVAQQLTAGTLENVWQSIVGTQEVPESYRSVAYLGTEMSNNVFTIWATVDGDDFQFTLTFSAEGVLGLQITPIQEWTPPEYVDEGETTEEPISLETPLDCELEGEITLPAETDDPVPGVVLVHGNGPQDMDAAVGPNRPFKEIAWGLAANGIAVLRYDKRTFACEVDIANATIDDIVTDDALTALDRLREHDRVDRSQVFVGGFSFGGLLTPRIATRDGNLAGTVMLAPGPTRSFATTIVDQMEHLLDLQQTVGPQREEILSAVEAEAEQMRNLDIDDDEVVRYGGLQYHETLQAYDHEETAAALEIPQLLLQGANDWQVTVEDDLPVWEEAIGDRDDVTITVYDDLNHLFQESEGQQTQTEYAEPDSPVDERVIQDITSFITESQEADGQTAERRVLAR